MTDKRKNLKQKPSNNNDKIKENAGRDRLRQLGINPMLAGVCVLLLFAVIFFYFLLRGNRPTDTGDEEIKSNLAFVNSIQVESVEQVEKQIEELNRRDRSSGSNLSDVHAWYMAKMSESVVIGDSLTEGLSVYGWLSEGQVFSEIGASVISSGEMFSKAAKLYPKHAFFAFGMNDMGNFSGKADDFIKEYGALIDSFRKESPKTQILVCSISMPNEDAISGNKSLGYYADFNKAIAAMCKQKKIKFLDSTYILKEHPELYAEDGIHVTSEYYPKWLDNMISEAGIR